MSKIWSWLRSERQVTVAQLLFWTFTDVTLLWCYLRELRKNYKLEHPDPEKEKLDQKYAQVTLEPSTEV